MIVASGQSAWIAWEVPSVLPSSVTNRFSTAWPPSWALSADRQRTVESRLLWQVMTTATLVSSPNSAPGSLMLGVEAGSIVLSARADGVIVRLA
jgi:hypothetical protein